MKTVKITEILDYYDGILAFVAQDPIGGQYVASRIERTSQEDRYLVVGTKPERLDDLRNGKVDLRTLLLEMPDGQWYITIPEGTLGGARRFSTCKEYKPLEPPKTPANDQRMKKLHQQT